MKKALVGLFVLAGITYAGISVAHPPPHGHGYGQPHGNPHGYPHGNPHVGPGHHHHHGYYRSPFAATRGWVGGIYTWVCPLGWSPVSYGYAYAYAYTVVVGYRVGPYGQRIPITAQRVYTVPAGITYCVPNQPIYLVP